MLLQTWFKILNNKQKKNNSILQFQKMTPRIITYFLCGMRHPNTGLSEGDLSRLTGSSSSSASSVSSSSSSSSSSEENTPAHKDSSTTEKLHHKLQELHEQQLHQSQTSPEKISTALSTHNLNNNNNKNSLNTQQQQILTSTRFSSTYLPEIINPSEWQKSRKRKERLDSTSSATQDRKLQRSNSEELLPPDLNKSIDADNIDKTADGDVGRNLTIKKSTDVIRRVSSEDFKKSPYVVQEIEPKDNKTTQENSKVGNENDASLANRQKIQQQQQQQQQQGNEALPPNYTDKWGVSGPTKDMTRRSRYETSPARSHRHSPMRATSGNGNGNGNGSANGKHRDSDDSECEHERRRSSERFCKTRAPPGRKAAGVTKKSSGMTGNNVIKYMPAKRNDENVYKYDLSALKYERRGFVSKKVSANTTPTAEKPSGNDHNDNNLIDFHKHAKANTPISPTPSSTGGSSDDNSSCTVIPSTKTVTATKLPVFSEQEVLPWERSVPDDQAPVLSRRYAAVHHYPHNADNIDTAATLAKVMPYPQQHKQQSAAHLYAGDMDDMEPIDTFRAFTSLGNVRTRDVIQQVLPVMRAFQSPEERLKQINKRMTALKKKLTQLEEAFEARSGYRPSQAERLNDKYMKNILAELSKLRKERQELKNDAASCALGLKVSGGMDATKKLEKMKLTLQEIEQNLSDKQHDANRSNVLDELTPDQLLAEKSAVQHGLLYFESLYGRPNSKDERDVARAIYDRYRQIKRMVSRSVMLSGCSSGGVHELPTILEHEAMVFESTISQQYSSNNSTETTNSPSDSAAPTTAASSDDSTTTTTSTQQTAAADANENIGQLSIDQLWEHLEKAREDKKMLKRTIRDYETVFEEQNGRKMLKNDRRNIEETYAQYKEKKAKTRLLQALIKKQLTH
ncbi:uncharacterized protein LOC119675359 isoform X1 [Teleopsis dalmanni]|uniref:uncharacterized protein LOC119675359 isoform X1 n=2 Tax=Teleopsis dalmanni TaxID=139649 RepID=UPI0018CFA077|nr:uncharacterized protein LOC119675359 isoform X1 [Teleopsis dalmanni]